MAKEEGMSSERVADALERIADTLGELLSAWQEREKKFAERASKPRFGDRGDRGPPRSGGFKKDFGDRGDRPFKKSFDRDEGGDRPFKKRFDDRGGDDGDFKKRGPRSTFRDFDAPKNRGPKKFGDRKPAGAGGFKGKKKF